MAVMVKDGYMLTDITPQECIRIYGKHRTVEYGPVYNSFYAKLIGYNVIFLECCRCENRKEKRVNRESYQI